MREEREERDEDGSLPVDVEIPLDVSRDVVLLAEEEGGLGRLGDVEVPVDVSRDEVSVTVVEIEDVCLSEDVVLVRLVLVELGSEEVSVGFELLLLVLLGDALEDVPGVLVLEMLDLDRLSVIEVVVSTVLVLDGFVSVTVLVFRSLVSGGSIVVTVIVFLPPSLVSDGSIVVTVTVLVWRSLVSGGNTVVTVMVSVGSLLGGEADAIGRRLEPGFLGRISSIMSSTQSTQSSPRPKSQTGMGPSSRFRSRLASA